MVTQSDAKAIAGYAYTIDSMGAIGAPNTGNPSSLPSVPTMSQNSIDIGAVLSRAGVSIGQLNNLGVEVAISGIQNFIIPTPPSYPTRRVRRATKSLLKKYAGPLANSRFPTRFNDVANSGFGI
ncbi:MAG: hypothetical protein VB959_24385 [Rhodospirillales bacterium]